MTQPTSNTEPEPPAVPGVHVHVNVNQGAPAPAPSTFTPSRSMIGYAAVGFIVICAVIGLVATQLVSLGIITIGV